MSNAASSSKPVTIGALVRWLRQAAGLTRLQLEHETGVSVGTLRNLETERCVTTAEILLQLLQSDSMARLPEKAKQAGLPMGLGDDEADCKV